jgi:hypothetical protein
MRKERHLQALELWSEGKTLKEIGQLIGREDGRPGGITGPRVREMLISARRDTARLSGVSLAWDDRHSPTRHEAMRALLLPAVMDACFQADQVWRSRNYAYLEELWSITAGGERMVRCRY